MPMLFISLVATTTAMFLHQPKEESMRAFMTDEVNALRSMSEAQARHNMTSAVNASSNMTHDHDLVDPMNELAKMKVKVDKMKTKSSALQKADPLTHAMFDPVIEQIRTIVRSNVKEAIDGLEGRITTHVKEAYDCSDLHGFAATSGEFYSPAATDLTTKKQTMKTDCAAAVTAVDSRDNAGKTLYETVKNSVGCSQTADVADVPMDALNFPLANVDSFAQTVIQQHTDWQNAAQAAATAETLCTNGKQAKTLACAKLQQLADAGKSAYDKCWNQAKGSYDLATQQLLSTDPSSPMEAMRSQIENVESLICYIKVAIDDGEASKFECKQLGMKLVCDCKDGDKEVYSDVEYDFAANPDLIGEKDRAWNDKGCSALADLNEACSVHTDCDSGACGADAVCVEPEPTPPPCVDTQIGECNQNGKGDCCEGMQCTAWNGKNYETDAPDSTKICINKSTLESGFYR